MEKLLELAAPGDDAAGPWGMRRGRPTSKKWKAKAGALLRHARRRAQRKTSGSGRRHAKMPLIIGRELARTRQAALAGLERWKAKHAEAASHLAVDDVLVDSMRGRSSTWTRIRVNLRHVPEDIRPPQETPDPDDDPTREWREHFRKSR